MASSINAYQMHDINNFNEEKEASHYQSQLRLLGKGCIIKELFV